MIGALVLTTVGVGAILVAPDVGSLLYRNHSALPSVVASQMHPDLYSEFEYRVAFQEWALWPAAILILSGMIVLAVTVAPPLGRHMSGEKRVQVALWFVAILGIAIRLRAYLTQRALWGDEAAFAFSFDDQGPLHLLLTPLYGGQSAPPGFIATTWLSVTLFGTGEAAIRLTPFLFGIATVVLAKLVTDRLFASSLAKITFLGFVAFSPVLVYYSQELKPYVVDAFVTVVAIWMFSGWDRQRNKWVFGLIGAVLVQFSLTSVFVLAALGLAVVTRGPNPDGRLAGFRLVIRMHYRVFLLWLAGGLLHGWYLVTAGTDADGMRETWQGYGAFPSGESVGGFFSWLFQAIGKLVWMAFYQPSRAGPELAIGPYAVVVTVLVIFFAGIFLGRTGRSLSIILFAISIIAAAVSLYPFFGGRLNLYLVPIVGLVLASLLERLGMIERPAWPRRVGLVLSSLLFGPLFVSMIMFGRPEDTRDMRWMINEYDVRHQDGDVLTAEAGSTFAWYQSQLEQETQGFVLVEDVVSTPQIYAENTIWVISSSSAPSDLVTALANTHRLECSGMVSLSKILVLKPIDSPEATEGYCNFAVPKY